MICDFEGSNRGDLNASIAFHRRKRVATKGVFQSGQMGQTVNLLLFSFGGSNPSAPTATHVASGGPNLAEDLCKASESLLSQLAEAKAPANWHPPICGNSSVDRALAFQAGGRGFESRFPLNRVANVAQW